MAKPRIVTAAVEIVEIEYGVWCEACALSSAVVVTLAITIANRTVVQTRTVCEGEHA